MIINQVKPGRGAQRVSSGVIRKAQGGKSHASIYVGDGKIAHIFGYDGAVTSLKDTYLKGDRSLLVVRPDGDGKKIADLAEKTIHEYKLDKLRMWRVGASDMLPAGAQGRLFKKVKKGRAICTTTVADILDKSGVDLPKNPGSMLAVDFQKMADPPVIKFQGTSKEVRTSPVQGAGIMIPGITIGLGAAFMGKEKRAFSSGTITEFWNELDKLADSKAEQNVKNLTEQLEGSKGLFTNKKIKVYYTDPHRGAGHWAQGKAIVEALERLGVDAELVNFDEEYIKPEYLERGRKNFQRFYNNPTHLNWLANVDSYKQMHGPGILKEKLVRDLSDPKVQPVFANVHLGHTAQKFGVFRGIGVHTDQEAWGWADPNEGGWRGMRHIVPESASEGLFRQHRSIKDRAVIVPDLAISTGGQPKMVDSLTGKRIKIDGKFNITVSGGGLGIDVDKMTTELLKSDLPKGTVVHVITGGVRVDGKISANQVFAEAQKIKPPPGVEVRVYGWVPLQQMMKESDLNVLRPHGTSITEATASGKPFILSYKKGGHASARLNAQASARITGQEYATTLEISKAVNKVVSGYDGYVDSVQKRAEKAAVGADEIAKAIVDLSKKEPPKPPPPSVIRETVTKITEIGGGGGGGGGGRAKSVVAGGALVGLAGSAALLYGRGEDERNKNGHWRKISPSWRGRDRFGNPQTGRTWVKSKTAAELLLEKEAGAVGEFFENLIKRKKSKIKPKPRAVRSFSVNSNSGWQPGMVRNGRVSSGVSSDEANARQRSTSESSAADESSSHARVAENR